MNQISTEVKSHIIIFHDKSRQWITEKQFEEVMLESNGNAKGILINGSFITFSSISKILDKVDFYGQYPKEVPENRERIPFVPIMRTAEGHQRMFKGILTELKQYIDEQITVGAQPKNSAELYKKHLSRYKELFAK